MITIYAGTQIIWQRELSIDNTATIAKEDSALLDYLAKCGMDKEDSALLDYLAKCGMEIRIVIDPK